MKKIIYSIAFMLLSVTAFFGRDTLAVYEMGGKEIYQIMDGNLILTHTYQNGVFISEEKHGLEEHGYLAEDIPAEINTADDFTKLFVIVLAWIMALVTNIAKVFPWFARFKRKVWVIVAFVVASVAALTFYRGEFGLAEIASYIWAAATSGVFAVAFRDWVKKWNPSNQALTVIREILKSLIFGQISSAKTLARAKSTKVPSNL